MMAYNGLKLGDVVVLKSDSRYKMTVDKMYGFSENVACVYFDEKMNFYCIKVCSFALRRDG